MAGMLIAGERTEGAAGEGIDVVDPATEETIESVPRGTAAGRRRGRPGRARGVRRLVRRPTPRTARTCCARRSR